MTDTSSDLKLKDPVDPGQTQQNVASNQGLLIAYSFGSF